MDLTQETQEIREAFHTLIYGSDDVDFEQAAETLYAANVELIARQLEQLDRNERAALVWQLAAINAPVDEED